MNETGIAKLRGVLRRRRIPVVATMVGVVGVAAQDGGHHLVTLAKYGRRNEGQGLTNADIDRNPWALQVRVEDSDDLDVPDFLK